MQRVMFFLTLVIAASGCGGSSAPEIAECKGTVTYGGNPVSGATVTFFVRESPLAVGTTDAEGKFVLTTGGRKGAPLGEAMVGISKEPETSGPDMTGMNPEDMMKMQTEDMGKKAKATKPPIPLKYAAYDKSGLTANVTADAATNDFAFILND